MTHARQPEIKNVTRTLSGKKLSEKSNAMVIVEHADQAVHFRHPWLADFWT